MVRKKNAMQYTHSATGTNIWKENVTNEATNAISTLEGDHSRSLTLSPRTLFLVSSPQSQVYNSQKAVETVAVGGE